MYPLLNSPGQAWVVQARGGDDRKQGLVSSDVAGCASVSFSVIRVIIAPAWGYEEGMERVPRT